MNQKEIITALNNDSYNVKLFAGKLLNICKLLPELKKMEGYKVELKGIIGNYDLVKLLPKFIKENFKQNYLYEFANKSQNNLKNLYGDFNEWQQIEISHLKGSYKFNLPLNNAFYNTMLTLLGLTVESAVIEPKQGLKSIVLSSVVLDLIKKAKTFTSNDGLRLAMNSICLHFENNTCQVVATDSHQMFLSRLIPCNSGNDVFNVLLSSKGINSLSAIKNPLPEIEIITFEDFTATIGGIDVKIIDANFPDYKVVVPNYENSMLFDRVTLIDKVKGIEIYSNISTKQINFHINGSIELSAQDVDFSFESTSNMPYVSKSFVDMDIAFNGKLLRNVLSAFKENKIKMQSDGINTRSVIFTDNVDSVLLMPLMLNSYR